MKTVLCLLVLTMIVSQAESYGGTWNNWTHWGGCGASRPNFKIRNRSCQPDGGSCLGSYKQGLPCKKTNGYRVRGHWTAWTHFGDCGAKKANFQVRTRYCQPKDVSVCSGSYMQGKKCTSPPPHPKPSYLEPASVNPGTAPPYGEPAYPRPVYGEPAYCEPAYGEPAYDEPAYGEPAYGEPANPTPAPSYSEENSSWFQKYFGK